jgi:5-methylthioadenosine/S-adenosylhomocysteine deaminase
VPSLLVRAGWLIVEPARVVQDGALLIDDDGRVAWCGSARDAPAADVPLRDEPLGVAVAGFVNAHTHLELTHLEALVSEPDFPDWIARVRRLKDASSSAEFGAAARLGLVQMFAQGITTVADTGSTGSAAHALAELGGRGIAFHEVFGPDHSQAESALRGLIETLDSLAPYASDRVRLGVSPHAPYTVSDALAHGALAVARERGLPLAVHVAESPEETAFLRTGDGPFAQAHRRRGIPVAPRARSSVAWLADIGLLQERCLCVHCVQVDAKDIDLLAEAGAPVAHCPLSNAAHGHGAAPLARMRRQGIAVGLGTDSVASQRPLALRAEAHATDLPPREQLELLTVGGGHAVGLADVGTLRPGAWGDLAVVGAGDAPDPLAAALAGPVQLTVIGGRIVFDARREDPGAAVWSNRVAEARRRLGAIGKEPAASR